jgi:hypothetical protein
MTISQRYAGILLLQLICLLLIVFSWDARVSRLLGNDASAINVHLCQNSDDFANECADMDEDSVEFNDEHSLDYLTIFYVSLPPLPSVSWKLHPVEARQYFSLIYLPIFSPPKISGNRQLRPS